ncbi:MAG TPA: hypothetical protein VGI10_19335 [Polyangiaceae bacterium]
MLFLDANVILDIAAHESSMRKKSDSAFPARAHPDLLGCLSRLKSKSAKIFVTPAVLEEVFHVLWVKLLTHSKQKWACSACAPKATPDREVRRHHPSEFTAVRAATIRIFSQSITDMKKHGAHIWIPGDEPAKVGQKVMEAFLATLTRYDAVGGKDALHIAMAPLFECSAFATRDEGFRQVEGITVYCGGHT